jgi:hypothetical protein
VEEITSPPSIDAGPNKESRDATVQAPSSRLGTEH